MDKEKATRDISIRVQPSLFNKFQDKCRHNYKTVSEVIREFMLLYIKQKHQ